MQIEFTVKNLTTAAIVSGAVISVGAIYGHFDATLAVRLGFTFLVLWTTGLAALWASKWEGKTIATNVRLTVLMMFVFAGLIFMKLIWIDALNSTRDEQATQASLASLKLMGALYILGIAGLICPSF